MFREEKLQRKIDELQGEVKRWAAEEGILSPDECISLNFSIARSGVCQRSISEKRMDEIMEMSPKDFFSHERIASSCHNPSNKTFSTNKILKIISWSEELMGMTSMREFCKITEAELLKYRSLGRKTLHQVIELLNRDGLELGRDYPKQTK